jgi:hypothetical protein
MNPIRPNEFDDDQLLAYHLGELSETERQQVEQAIAEDETLKEASESLAKILAPLADYEVEVPAGLERKLKFNARAQTVTVDTLLKDYTGSAPSRKRLFFGRMADFVATAAAIALICSAVLLSTGHARQQARKALCAGNLGSLGSALASYANDYYNQLPQANLASNNVWYDAARKQPRRVNLFVLVKQGYTSPEFLVCPEDAANPIPVTNLSNCIDFPTGSVVSYSFQNLHGDRNFTARQLQQRWERAQQMPIMADRTPLIRQGKLAQELATDQMASANHGSLKGQNILTLDGRVLWQDSPLFGPQRDNIWKAGQIRRYSGQETPADSTDSFLAP